MLEWSIYAGSRFARDGVVCVAINYRLGVDGFLDLGGGISNPGVAFAKSGYPGWPRYDLQRRARMRFDTISAVVDDPGAEERALWEGLR